MTLIRSSPKTALAATLGIPTAPWPGDTAWRVAAKVLPRRLAARVGHAVCAGLLWASGAALAQDNDAGLLQCRQETDAAKRLACYDKLSLRAQPVVAAPAAQSSGFGLPAPAAAVAAIDSVITGKVEGWGPRTRFTFADGQVWEIEDGSTAALNLQNPKVKVRRGFGGAFYLELTGTNLSPRVRRVR